MTLRTLTLVRIYSDSCLIHFILTFSNVSQDFGLSSKISHWNSSFSFLAIKPWSVTKHACIKNNNERIFKNVQTLKECQEKCESYSWCRSLDYNAVENKCHLSKLTSSSQFYYHQCYVAPDDFIYAEIDRG